MEDAPLASAWRQGRTAAGVRFFIDDCSGPRNGQCLPGRGSADLGRDCGADKTPLLDFRHLHCVRIPVQADVARTTTLPVPNERRCPGTTKTVDRARWRCGAICRDIADKLPDLAVM